MHICILHSTTNGPWNMILPINSQHGWATWAWYAMPRATFVRVSGEGDYTLTYYALDGIDAARSVNSVAKSFELQGAANSSPTRIIWSEGGGAQFLPVLGWGSKWMNTTWTSYIRYFIFRSFQVVIHCQTCQILRSIWGDFLCLKDNNSSNRLEWKKISLKRTPAGKASQSSPIFRKAYNDFPRRRAITRYRRIIVRVNRGVGNTVSEWSFRDCGIHTL